MLDAGQPVKRIDFDHYVVAGTGERLTPVEPVLPSVR